MSSLIVRAGAVWLLLAVLAIINGVIREKLFVPLFGEQPAHPLSGILLSALILVSALIVFRFLGISSSAQAWLIGGIWLLFTVAFEFLFGHFVAGESWSKLFEAYNVSKANLWVLVLIATVSSPYVAGKLRGFI